MQADGVDPKVLDMDPEGPAPTGDDGGVAAAEGEKKPGSSGLLLLKDDPEYTKYFKMLRMHLPKGAVKSKMRAEGKDPTVLDMDPDGPSPSVSQPKVKRTGGGFQLPPRPPKYPKKVSEKPPVPMRALFWQRIQIEDLDDTVWCKLKDDTVPLDPEKLMTQFSKAVKKADRPDTPTSSGVDEDAAKKEKKKEINILDPKVLQNVGIALAKYRMHISDIRLAILRMDENLLGLDKVASLYALRPSPEDRSSLQDFEGDKENLGKVEKFFLEIMDIPRYDQRLECFIFKLKFHKEVAELHNALDVVKAGTKEVLRSRRFRRLLEVVLKVGNFLNGGTSRGGLYGFKLDALNKLATIKSVDNKQTLMHFIADWCQQFEPTLLHVHEELEHVPMARRHPLQAVSADFKTLEKKVSLLESQIQQSENDQKNGRNLPEDRFVEHMQPFLVQAKEDTKKAEEEFSEVQTMFAKMLKSFGEDPSTVGCSEFFGEILTDFLFQFGKAKAQNDKWRLLEEKARQKEAAARLKQQQREERLRALEEAGQRAEAAASEHKDAAPSGRSRLRWRQPSTITDGTDPYSSGALADNIANRMRTIQQPGKGGAVTKQPSGSGDVGNRRIESMMKPGGSAPRKSSTLSSNSDAGAGGSAAPSAGGGELSAYKKSGSRLSHRRANSKTRRS